MVLLPWSNAGSAASIPTNARSPHAFLPPSADAARLSESSAPAGALNEIVPGSVGDLGPPLTRAELAQDRSRIGFNATDPGSGNAVWIAAQQALRSSERPSPGGGSPGPAYRSAAPVSATNASWFVGFVNDSTDRKGLSGVAVAERSATYCDPTICTGATTNSTGAFVMGCEAPGGLGNDYTLQVTGVYWWMDNASYDVCVAGKTTNVGTMFLVRDGSARGTVEEAGTGVPVPNVSVTATSRLGTTVAVPGNTTGASGQFVVAVPAEPSQIYFTPPTGYQTTFNYTNATPGTGSRPTHPPWLNSINAGTIYLTRETVVRATLFDSSTGQPIGASDLSAIQGCNALTGSCPPPGATVYGPNPEAFAEPGPTFFEVDAVGYTVTATPTVTIPPEPPGTPYDLSPVWVTPVGTVSVRPALSMPTGGSLPFTSPSGSPGVIGSYVCSLDGYQFPVLQPSGNFTGFDCVAGPCLSLGASSAIPGAPLRDLVYIFPNTGAACGVWSAPPDTPAFPVQLTVNLTAGYSLAATVPANLSVGDYVAGSILDAATGHAPSGCFIVTARPSDSFYLNTQGIAWNSCLDNSSIYWAPCASLGSLSPGSFCAPVPPGDSYLRVSDLNYASNWTWISVPQYCCHTTKGQPGYPATLRSATSNGVDSINLTPVEGNVTGWVVSGGPSPGGGVPGYSVSVCPMFAPPGTNCGYASARGSRFNVTGAPVGLDLVKVGAVGYSSNSIWLNVSPTGIADAGTIPLDPYGTIAGTVVNPSGNGVYLASIQYCTLDNASACYAGAGNDLGLGFTSTDGTFNGTVPGGWLPGATYVIASTASGYSTNWEFANASADGFVTLPPLTLTPIGVTGGRPMVPTTPKGSTSPPAGVWFTGRLIDSVTSAGVDLGVAGLLAACPLGIGVFCGGVPDGTNSEGFFNGSVSPGLYYVNISTSGYAPASVYLNATGTGFVNLGNIVLRADGWLAGRVVLAPWTSVTLNASGISGQGYAPSAVVTGCDANGSDCQLQLPISSNGTFNVSVPTGSKATIQVAPTAGLLPNTSLESLHGAYTQLSGATSDIPLEIFGEVTGQVLNGNSGAAANLSGRTYIGLPFALVTVVEGGVNPGSSSVLSDTEGMWVAFVPGGNGPGNTTVQATSDPGYDAFFQKVHAAVDPGVGTPSFVSSNLSHYGWIVGQFDAAGSGVPIASASVTVNGVDPGTLANVTVGAETNLDGFVNVTAPPGTLDSLTVSGAFVNATVYAVGTVRGEATTFLSGSSYATLGTQSVESDGWVLSDELTFSSSPPPLSGLPTPVITDPVNGLGVSGAEVTVSSNDPAIAPSVPVRSNSAGQFYTDAPPGGQDLVQVRALGYLPNLTAHSISPGAFDVYSLINLTGDAVIAGTVVAIPNGTGIPGASVALCAPTASGSACSTTTTNQSGAFWATVAPGHTEVWVNASGYVGNSSSVPTCSDCWVSIGAIHLPPDGGVTGKVVGVPANLALSGAQVSVCPQALYQGSPCGLTVETNAHGQFFLTAPPAYYELIAVAPGYNLTASVVQITVGQ
ncbi:MAG: hypothetical protein L3K08_01230, partial [Thermoplasmata archaeon]|nr:hypothetical protein [Thermoplasmata archaeon]